MPASQSGSPSGGDPAALPASTDEPLETLSRGGRWLVLFAAFSGWMFAGWEMSLLPLAARSATIGMVREQVASGAAEPLAPEQLDDLSAEWFAKYIAAFLFGAALGGWLLGVYGDRAGRVKAMTVSVLWYSLLTAASYFVSTPAQLAAMRFLACMGIGGMWPAGVALVSEAWPDVSRPTLAGLIGASANVGIALLGVVVERFDQWFGLPLTPDSWRWIMLLGGLPALLGVVCLWVPESPRWLREQRRQRDRATPPPSQLKEIFRPPLLSRTLAGIAIGTIPLLGAWGAQKWIVPWADKVGAEIGQLSLKANVQFWWAVGATIGSLCGGWLATLLGRRTTYFLVSLGALLLSGVIFQHTTPEPTLNFMGLVFLLGLITTVYFGWLPLFLPELFPTRVRATGAGVSFNSGRIISGAVVLASVHFMPMLGGDYAKIGSAARWVYAAGMLVILAVPPPLKSIED
ncbi:MAG: MFS transporter [Planctomycetales bacterium]|nr:MFS transporter [Planctomycetales bacterium]